MVDTIRTWNTCGISNCTHPKFRAHADTTRTTGVMNWNSLSTRATANNSLRTGPAAYKRTTGGDGDLIMFQFPEGISEGCPVFFFRKKADLGQYGNIRHLKK